MRLAQGAGMLSNTVRAAAAAFVLLLIPAMRAYPGGTQWDPRSQGHDFWLNYLCDLTRHQALNGQPNPVGAALAQAALAVLALGLIPLWWMIGQRAVRVLGSLGAVGALAVVLLPSDRFGAWHEVAIVLAGPPSLLALLLALFTLARERRAAAAIGALLLLVAGFDFALYAGHSSSIAVAILEWVSLALLLTWMLVCSSLHTGAQRSAR